MKNPNTLKTFLKICKVLNDTKEPKQQLNVWKVPMILLKKQRILWMMLFLRWKKLLNKKGVKQWLTIMQS